jgi:formate hydrogenlyase subunit 5
MAHVRATVVEDRLLAAFDSAREEGWELLLAGWTPAGGRVTFLAPATGEIREVAVGVGPFRRPSRHGWPSFWGVEGTWPDDAWAEPAADVAVAGSGLHLMPLGPVRADVAESLRYEMAVLGDEIHHVRLVAGLKRRRVLAALAGTAPDVGVSVAERISGTAAFAHALAFCEAVEAAAGLAVPPEEARLRVILAELERVASHLGDLAALAAATGTIVAGPDLLRLKEEVLRFNARVTGHRYLRGVLTPGGLRRPVALAEWELRTLVARVGAEFGSIRRHLDRTNAFLDRLHGAGRIPAAALAELQLTGFVGKSAGRDRDERWDRPYAAYAEAVDGLRPVSLLAPDAYGRYAVRADEVLQSLTILRRMAADLTLPPHRPARLAVGRGIGVVEAPRGRLAIGVWLEGDTVRTADILTPSQLNFAAVPVALANHNILQDFPIVDASFLLSVAELDL